MAGLLIGCYRSNAAAVIMGVTYGIAINSTEDRYIAIAEKALEGMARAASPGAFLVDLLPVCPFFSSFSTAIKFIYPFAPSVKYVPYVFHTLAAQR